LKKTRIPGWIDVIKVDRPDEIDEMTRNPQIDRRFTSLSPVINGLLLGHVLAALCFRGQRFPTMSPRECPARARKQELLWVSLNREAPSLKLGPDQLENLAVWLRGTGNELELGMLVQQIVGRSFSDTYTATSESWSAALALDAAPRKNNPFTLLVWWLTGRVRKAKTLLASKVNGDLAGIHGTGVALHNIVKSFQHMSSLYSNLSLRSSLSPEEVSRQCLFAPASILRQATGAGDLAGCPFRKGTLFVAALSEARKKSGSEEVVFLRNSWSRCPAEQWVPALLEGVWRRSTEHF